MDMSDASMGEVEEGDPMMQSPRSNDGAAASGPDVAALGDALESPIEITDIKVPPLSHIQAHAVMLQTYVDLG